MIKTFLVIASIITFSSAGIDKLTGSWKSKPSVNGNVTSVVFKADNSFEGFVNKKPFVTGRYNLQDSIFTFTDNGCNGRQGIYKLDFFSYGDSLRFIPLNDSCQERKEGMSRLILGKVK